MCVCVYMYIYILYIYIHIHTHIYIYTHIYTYTTHVCVNANKLVCVGFLFCFVLSAPVGSFLYFFIQTEIGLLLLCKLNIHPHTLGRSFAFRVCTTAVVLTFECALESPGGLVKPQMASPPP